MNAIIEMGAFGGMVGLLYIIIVFFIAVALWYTFTFIMWRIYRHNRGKYDYFSYIRLKGLGL